MKIYLKKKSFEDKETGEMRDYIPLCFEEDGVETEMTVKGSTYKFPEAFEEYGVTARKMKALKPGEVIEIGEF